MWKTWHTILCCLATPVLIGVAWLFQGYGFDVLQQMRQLERTPRSKIISVIEGEVNLEGQTIRLGQRLQAPHSGENCLYYLWILEEERQDDEGDTYWAEIDRKTERVDQFGLKDDTGGIRVVPIGAEINVESHTYRAGSYRHTEYRLHPGDTVFVFGYADNQRSRESGYVVEFQTKGQYTPIISTYGEKGERQNMASSSLWWSFGALAAASFGVMFGCWTLQVHRLLTFLSIVSMLQGVGLVYLGLTMLKHDLESSHGRSLKQQQRAKQVIQTLLAQANISWKGDWGNAKIFAKDGPVDKLPPGDAARIRGIYGDVAAGITRFNAVRARFPERVLAPMWSIKPLPEMPRAEIFAPDFSQQRVIEKVPISNWVFWLMSALGIPAACIFPWYGFRKIREKRYIENIPTSLSTGLAFGPAEIKGTARKDQLTFEGPVSGLDCLFYHYVVKEKRGSGKKAKWVTIIDEEKRASFICEDAAGQTRVDLDKAEIHTKHKHSRSSGNRIYTETNLRPDDQMYILGPAVIDETTGDRLKIAEDDLDFPLIVANLSETQMMSRKGRRGLGLLNLGLNGFVLTALAAFGATASYAPTDYLLSAFIAPIFLSICFIVLMFNDLHFVRHRVRRAWANIDVSLKKRADLLPNLEAVAKEYFTHEKSIHKGIAKMRAHLSGDLDPASADKMLATEKTVTSRLLAVKEDYPDLKGNEVAQKLFDQIVKLENEIALMREGYNDSVERHNTRIQSLPEVILAKLFGFKDAQPLRVKLEVRRAPKVDLNVDAP